MLNTPITPAPFEVASTSDTFWRLYNAVQYGAPFVYSRFGDGDFEIMLGGADSWHLPNKDLANELWELYDHPKEENWVANAMHTSEPGMTQGLFAPWLNPKYTTFRHLRRYENAIALHFFAAFKPTVLRLLFHQVARRPVIFVGSRQTEATRTLLGDYAFVRVPDFNAYATIGQWYPEVARAIDGHDLPLVVTAAGMASRAINLRLLKSERQVQALDLGSLVDFVDGIQSRTWMKLVDPNNREILLGRQ